VAHVSSVVWSNAASDARECTLGPEEHHSPAAPAGAHADKLRTSVAGHMDDGTTAVGLTASGAAEAVPELASAREIGEADRAHAASAAVVWSAETGHAAASQLYDGLGRSRRRRKRARSRRGGQQRHGHGEQQHVGETDDVEGGGEEGALALPRKLRKYWHRRHQLWSRYDAGIMMDAESWYSVTPEAAATHGAAVAMAFLDGEAPAQACSSSAVGGSVPDPLQPQPSNGGAATTLGAPSALTQRNVGNGACQPARGHTNAQYVVADVFAGAGGNAIAFARHPACRHVLAIERDADRCRLLAGNARVYGVADRITVLQCDAGEWLFRCCEAALAGAELTEATQLASARPPDAGADTRSRDAQSCGTVPSVQATRMTGAGPEAACRILSLSDITFNIGTAGGSLVVTLPPGAPDHPTALPVHFTWVAPPWGGVDYDWHTPRFDAATDIAVASPYAAALQALLAHQSTVGMADGMQTMPEAEADGDAGTRAAAAAQVLSGVDLLHAAAVATRGFAGAYLPKNTDTDALLAALSGGGDQREQAAATSAAAADSACGGAGVSASGSPGQGPRPLRTRVVLEQVQLDGRPLALQAWLLPPTEAE
jgi:hypothetical protein